MNDIETARALGWFSIALGATELIAGRAFADRLGLSRHVTLVRVFGVREIAAGVAVLARPDASAGLWARVAGDAMDMAVLATALTAGNPRRTTAAIATAAAAGVAIADILVAQSLTGRFRRALQTTQRARIRNATA